VAAEVFDWSRPHKLPPADSLLLCDCLYENYSVEVNAVPATDCGHVPNMAGDA
jgi:hypothetical protein